MAIKGYIEANKERFLEELFSLIRIPSISAKPEHKPDMERCAARWAELLLSSGADRAEVMPTEGTIGVIAPGARAHFVTLTDDPFAVPPEAIAVIRVASTWRDGVRLWANDGL